MFTALHTMQGSISHEKNVSLSVRPIVKRANCDKTKETSAYILYHDYPSFPTRRMVVEQ